MTKHISMVVVLRCTIGHYIVHFGASYYPPQKATISPILLSLLQNRWIPDAIGNFERGDHRVTCLSKVRKTYLSYS